MTDLATATGLRLDLGAGQRPAEGFQGVDIWDGADWVVDLMAHPWPWDDNTVEAIHCSHFVEHLYPVGGPQDGLIAFMEDAYRILKPGGTMRIVHPFAKHTRAFQDPTHTRFIPDATWWYFNAHWRREQGLDHYPITTDFEVIGIMPAFDESAPHQTHLRSQEAQMFALAHYWNVIADLCVDLKKPE